MFSVEEKVKVRVDVLSVVSVSFFLTSLSSSPPSYFLCWPSLCVSHVHDFVVAEDIDAGLCQRIWV